MSLRLGRVAKVHPEDHSVDLVLVDDGARLAGVQVLSYGASSDTGLVGLPTPATPASGDAWDLRQRTARDALAVVGFIGRQPVVLGFLVPQINGMTFKDGRLTLRHQSGAYLHMDPAGAIELVYPSGAYLRIGVGPHVSLAGKDFDHRWKEPVTAPAPAITIATGTGATVTLNPDGGMTVAASKDITMTTPNLRVSGNIIVTGGDVKADGISLKTHVHGGVDPGGGSTSGPS